MKNEIDIIFKKYNFDSYPRNYQEVLIQVIEESVKTFGNNLLNITLGGSGGKNKIHVGWSDLDIYFILKKYDINQVMNFMSIKWCHPIHVGTTYYTLDEVKNNVLDGKTKIMLYEKQNYEINPTIYGKELFPIISYEEVKANDFRNLANTLHEVRRSYIKIKNNEVILEKKYVKKLLVLMKCILDGHNQFVFGYEEVFDAFYKLNNGVTKEDGNAIIKIIKDINGSNRVYLDVCDDVFNYLEKDLRGE